MCSHSVLSVKQESRSPCPLVPTSSVAVLSHCDVRFQDRFHARYHLMYSTVGRSGGSYHQLLLLPSKLMGSICER